MHDMEPLHSNMIACRLVFDGLRASIGATILWKSWDASPPTLEIVETKCIRSHPTFANSCRFSLGKYYGELITGSTS